MDDIQLSPTASSAANDRAHAAALSNSLNRSSHLNVGFPTRTIRITEAERSSRDNTPNPITIEDLLHRPRSNPRTRTPMRYESPLESDAFRMERPTTDHDNIVNININYNNEARQISIRPLAGAAVGTLPRRSYEAIDERGKGRSVKQGPSQRKIRKWNNQHFGGLASEIESSNAAAADVLFKAHRDAHLYRSIYDPKDHRRSLDVDRFMNDSEMKDAREQFFEGYGPVRNDSPQKLKSSRNARVLNGDDMLHRMDPRLRRLVMRACHNSYAAAKVVELFESFIVQSFRNDKSTKLLIDRWWTDLLLECPTLTHRNDSRRSTAQFFFHPTLPTGGFHRLLLHAVCQFHGLNVVSRTEENYECIWGNGETTNGTRVLTATGDILDGTSSTNSVLLLQHLGENVDDSIGYIMNKNVEESLAGLRI